MKKPKRITLVLYGLCAVIWSLRVIIGVMYKEYDYSFGFFILNVLAALSCHYVDSWGFKELPGFLKPENYLKNAEMAMEDDYGMIDGIINNGPRKTVAELEEQSKTGTPISLLELAQAVQREDAEKRRAQQPVRREKSGEKPSILAKLKTPSVADTKSVKSAPKRSAEREL